MNNVIIVSRHKPTINFLIKKLGNVPVLEHINDPEVLKNKIVIGNIPAYMAAYCRLYIEVVLSLSKEEREQKTDIIDIEKRIKLYPLKIRRAKFSFTKERKNDV